MGELTHATHEVWLGRNANICQTDLGWATDDGASGRCDGWYGTRLGMDIVLGRLLILEDVL